MRRDSPNEGLRVRTAAGEEMELWCSLQDGPTWGEGGRGGGGLTTLDRIRYWSGEDIAGPRQTRARFTSQLGNGPEVGRASQDFSVDPTHIYRL